MWIFFFRDCGVSRLCSEMQEDIIFERICTKREQVFRIKLEMKLQIRPDVEQHSYDTLFRPSNHDLDEVELSINKIAIAKAVKSKC